MMHYMKNLVFFLLFCKVSLHLLRQKRARSAVFHKVFLSDKILSVTPLKTVLNVLTYDTCCDLCLRHDECLSVNYQSGGDRQCELLGEDREKHDENSFIEKKGWDYYDTVYRDLCNEKDSCYPCSCWSVEFYRSACDCKKFMATIDRYGKPDPIQIQFDHVNFQLICLGSNGLIYEIALTSDASWKSLISVGLISRLKVTEAGNIYGIGTSYGNVYTWNNGWIQKLSGLFSDIYMTDGFIFVILKASGELQRTPVTQESLEKATARTLSRFQEHNGVWYGIDASCKCIMKHPNEVSADIDKWEIITKNPGSSVEFKVAFNDIIYSLHEDQNIYKWVQNEWIKIFEGPCISFDVANRLYCLKTDAVVYAYKDFVPTPNVHIPFRTANRTGGYTPYGRGTDTIGNSIVQLDFEDNNIALDQFGKGYVLWKGHGAPVDLGNYNQVSLTKCSSSLRSYTMSLWVRITSQTEPDCSILSNPEAKGIELVYQNSAGQNYLEAKRKTDNSIYGYRTLINKELLYQWTHIIIRYRCDKKRTHLMINGVIAGEATETNVGNTDLTNIKVVCNGVYLSDLAIWYTTLHLSVGGLALYKSDLNAVGWNKKFTTVTEKSCEELKRQRPFTTSGYYWIIINEHMISVFCDMVTDGGGWTQLAYVDTELHGDSVTFFSDDISKIGDVYTKQFMLTSNGLYNLKSAMNFTQFRYHCTKSSHGRIVDIATATQQSIDYLTNESSELPDACGAYYELDDNTSQMTSRCAEFHSSKLFHKDNGSNRVDIILDIPSVLGTSIRYRTCDDVLYTGGVWKYYVR